MYFLVSKVLAEQIAKDIAEAKDSKTKKDCEFIQSITSVCFSFNKGVKIN